MWKCVGGVEKCNYDIFARLRKGTFPTGITTWWCNYEFYNEEITLKMLAYTLKHLLFFCYSRSIKCDEKKENLSFEINFKSILSHNIHQNEINMSVYHCKRKIVFFWRIFSSSHSLREGISVEFSFKTHVSILRLFFSVVSSSYWALEKRE